MKFPVITLVAVAIINVTTGALLGGLRDISKDDQGVQSAVEETRKTLTAGTDDMVKIEVMSAKYQVVAGRNYYLKLAVTVNQNGAYECNIEVFNDLSGDWFVKSTKPQEACYSMVNREKPTANRAHRSAHLLGGKEEIDLTEQGVQEAANWAVDHINGMSNSFYRQALQKIADGSRQVVNGLKYKFLLYLVSTQCRNKAENAGKSLEECPANDKPMRMQCDVTVLYSRKEYTMLDNKCKALKIENMLGGDDHDYKPHGNVKTVLGGDDHDYKPHGNVKTVLGGDDHDYKPHGNVKTVLGGDDHDYKPHGNAKTLLGGDDHDYKPHGNVNTLLGGDDHDYKPHGNVKTLLGGDDHDYKPHGNVKTVLGGDDHDYKPHGNKPVLGGDDHDYQPHNFDPCHQYRDDFEEFKSKYQRLYTSSQEETEKFQIFCGNMERVKEYQKMERGSAVYGATQFADISETEFKEKYLGWKMNSNGVRSWPSADIPKGPTPDSFDWRDHNAVTPVKNQGSCGSCWAFSTTGNIEGQNAIKHKKLVSLSEQELLDCDKIDEACQGGLPTQAYEALMELGGIETEKDYGYDGAKEKCQFNKSEVVVKLSGAVNISKDEAEMAAWLAKNGPISIGINAFAMQFYFGGIAHPWKIFCSPSRLDHGVLIVGYGKDGDEPYWIVKNSWGASWGRQGYYYVYRGDGTCGLNTMCTSAVVQ